MDLAFVSSNDEAFSVCFNCCDVKTVHLSLLMDQSFELPVSFTVDNVTLVSSDKKLAFLKPAMARVVVADVLFFFVEFLFDAGKVKIVLQLEKSVC